MHYRPNVFSSDPLKRSATGRGRRAGVSHRCFSMCLLFARTNMRISLCSVMQKERDTRQGSVELCVHLNEHTGKEVSRTLCTRGKLRWLSQKKTDSIVGNHCSEEFIGQDVTTKGICQCVKNQMLKHHSHTIPHNMHSCVINA